MAGTKTSIYLTDEARQALRLVPYGTRRASSAVNATVDRYALLMSEAHNDNSHEFTDREFKFVNDALKARYKGVVDSNIISGAVYAAIVLYKVAPEQEDLRRSLEDRVKYLPLPQQLELIERYESGL